MGPCEAAQEVAQWRCSVGMNENTKLFDEGTDPDDVRQGLIKDAWLLSAIR
jgi:hypothetical protein